MHGHLPAGHVATDPCNPVPPARNARLGQIDIEDAIAAAQGPDDDEEDEDDEEAGKASLCWRSPFR